MRIKKNCNGCKALKRTTGSRTGGMECELGYSTKDGKEIQGIIVETIPLELCPKPKTNSEYFAQII